MSLAEKAAPALRFNNEQMSDVRLIAMVVKWLYDEYKAFVAVVTQSEMVNTFQIDNYKGNKVNEGENDTFVL